MSIQRFNELVAKIASSIESIATGDTDLECQLNTKFGPDTPEFRELEKLCAEGEKGGWLLQREVGGIKFGRPIKANTLAGPFSVDVVRMKDTVGPHHIHTNGEIGAIMPIAGNAVFDGKPKGWYVYPPGSEHCPTVTNGDTYVLYLLPQGAIEFTGR